LGRWASENVRSGNGPEFVTRKVLGRISVKTLFIEPGSPWENGYCESFSSKLGDELRGLGAIFERNKQSAHRALATRRPSV
jgi:putative transposase